MFFRLKRSKSGEVLQLLESYRNAQGKPRQRVVLSLGDAPISRSDWKPIAKAVQKHLYGIQELLAPQYTRRQHNWIELIVRRIDGQGRWRGLRAQPEAKGHKQIDGVLVDEVEHSTTGLWLGPILLGVRGWEQLRIDEALKKVGFNRAQREAAKVTVINRLVEPVTENALAKWDSGWCSLWAMRRSAALIGSPLPRPCKSTSTGSKSSWPRSIHGASTTGSN